MKVNSYIPVVPPVSMIVLISIGNPPVWEIIVSLLILTTPIFQFGWLSVKIYRIGLLLYGKRPMFKELRKASKEYRT